MDADQDHTYNLDAERALIGIAMSRQGALDDLTTQPGDFHHPAHGALWWLLSTLHNEGSPTDPATVNSNLARIEGPAKVTAVLVFDCYQATPAGISAHHYARIVDASATRRRLLTAAERIAQLAHSGEAPAELVEMARSEVDATHRGVAESSLIGDGYAAFLDSLAQDSPAVPTPWDELNRVINGWMPGAVYVVAARPYIGNLCPAVAGA